MSSDVAYAEPDNRCPDMRTADTLATPRVFGDLKLLEPKTKRPFLAVRDRKEC